MSTLTQLRRHLRKCTTRKQVVKLVSKHVRSATLGRCDPPLLLTLHSSYGATECANGQTRTFDPPPFLNDEYISLRTSTGCDLSLVGLSTTDADIEITSDTAPSQQRKGYNTLLRAVAVMVSFVEGKAIRSEVSNGWSAYTLLKFYQTSVVTKDGRTTHYSAPLTNKEAMDAKTSCKQVFLRPTVVNLDIATRLFAETVVKCGMNA